MARAHEMIDPRLDIADPEDRRRPGDDPRELLLRGLPVAESRYDAAGISTAVQEGGEGPPIVLLHGPGEFAAKWMRVLPEMVRTHRVIAPDLPGHGATAAPGERPAEQLIEWLDELIERTCPSPPALVGHVLGGAIAARYAVEHSDRLNHLVLVDALGLGRFRPAPRFALAMIGFQIRPSERSYDRFMRQCSSDLDRLRAQMGDRWEPFVAYNLDRARSPRAKEVGRLMRTVGLPRIPASDLTRIAVPTSLIWGRHDLANRPRVAEAASARYGWPLQVIEDCADDPPRDQPEAFMRALQVALGRTVTTR
jgi:pimeloyl-ACP methyl ester carboxylesterase